VIGMAVPKERPDVELFAEIAMIDQMVASRLDRALPAGLTHAQFQLLCELCRRGGASPIELARRFQLTKGAITNTLQRLEASGLIALAANPDDGRRKQVTLTASGAAAHEAALASLRPLMASLRAAFGEDAFAAALPFLKDLRAWLQNGRWSREQAA
jgi:DNA-binding MarR family transcriptional regulator